MVNSEESRAQKHFDRIIALFLVYHFRNETKLCSNPQSEITPETIIKYNYFLVFGFHLILHISVHSYCII